MSDGGLHAGFAAASITPALPVHLSGYGDRVGVATAVHDDLEVRAFVVRRDRKTLCLLALDLMAMSEDWATPIREAVALALGVERGAVVTSTVHTHSAPSTLTGTDLIGWVVPTELRQPLVGACVEAARAANAALEPVRLRYARAPLPAHLSFNRRGNAYAPTLAVLDVLRRDGSRAGTISSIGVHPVVLGPRNLLVSADWVGAFRRALEMRAGGTALFLQGCEGDVDPEGRCLDGDEQEQFAAVDRVDAAFAAAVAEALDVAAPVDGPVEVAACRVLDVPVAGSPLEALAGGDGRLAVELVEWDLGGARLVTVPGEGFAGFGARVLGRREGPILLAGLAPHWLGYLPVPFGDGYEESLSYGEAAVAAILDAVVGGPG